MRRPKAPRGFLLLKVLLFLLLITVLVVTASGMMFGHLNYANHAVNRHRAQIAAHSLLNQAIAEVAEDQEWAQDISLQFTAEEGGGKAVLTFDQDSGQPFSVNNTRSTVDVECWAGGQNISNGKALTNTCHLVAVGTYRNARFVAEAHVAFPPHPYALASSGPVVSTGRLEVMGVASLSQAADGVSEDEKQEGNIVSNSSEAGAISLSSQAKVSGDVRAVGGVELNGASVEGEVKTNQQPADLPELDIEAYDPRRFDDAYNLELAAADAEGSGPLKASAQRIRVDTHGNTLELNNGVELDDGMLYVDGDVVIRGGVKGTGAIIATGKVTIYGASSLVSDMTAVVSGGGVVIDGQGLGVSKFQGLVATKGDFEADSTSIVGAYVATGVDPVTKLGTSKMKLRDVHAVHAADATKVDIEAHVELKKMFPASNMHDALEGKSVGIKDGSDFYPLTGDAALDSYDALKAPQGAAGHHPLESARVVVIDHNGKEVDVETLDLQLRIGVLEIESSWKKYLDSVTSKSVEVVPIFDIDLNRFTSGSSHIKVLTYR